MKTKYILTLAFIFLGLAFFCNTASAATIFTDNFESYDIGKLNGQGNWIANSSGVKVQNTYVKEGEKGIKVYGEYLFAYGAEKTGTSTNDGMITIYMGKFLGGTPNPEATIELKEGVSVLEVFHS